METRHCENVLNETESVEAETPLGAQVKATIPEDEFGSGTVDSTYQQQTWNGMGKLFQQETLSDVMLMTEGQSIPCHKFLLAAASEYFYDKLVAVSDAVGCHNLVEIEGISFHTLKIIVSYLYTGHIKITVENAEDMIPACKMLNLHSACEPSDSYLMQKISPANCIGLYKVAATNNMEQLKAKARGIMLTDFRDVVSGIEFQNMSFNDVEEYIQNDDLGIPNEDAVYDAVLSWIKYRPDNRSRHFSQLVKSIRFQFCSNYCLRYIVSKDPIMQTFEHQKLLVSALKHDIPDSFCWDDVHEECTHCCILPRRGYHTVPKMIVLGGIADPGNITKTECWKLEHDGWNVVEECSIPTKLRWFSACMVADRVIVSGGSVGGTPVSQCWLLSTSVYQWSLLPDLNTARLRHASVCAGGKVYAIGGDKGKLTPLSSCESLETKARKWKILPDIPTALYHVMPVSYRQHIYVFGGKTTDDVGTRSCYVFRPQCGEWFALPAMPQICQFGSAVVWRDNIYIVGGFELSCMSFDPVLSVWTTLSQCRHEHADGPALVWKDRILVCGGRSKKAKRDNGKAGGTSVMEEYNPETDTWTVSQIELPQKLWAHSVFAFE